MPGVTSMGRALTPSASSFPMASVGTTRARFRDDSVYRSPRPVEGLRLITSTIPGWSSDRDSGDFLVVAL